MGPDARPPTARTTSAPPARQTAGLTGAIVVGAGGGRRLGGVEKAWLPIGGRPLLCYAVDVFERLAEVDAICLVLSAASVERGALLARECGWRKVTAVVPGGRERQDSVRAGLDALAACQWVIIHDAARPLITAALVRTGLDAAQAHGAAVAATPVRDTLKRVEGASGRVGTTVDRAGLWAAQTPQVFRADLLRDAFAAVGDRAGEYTDDASLVEAAGHPVYAFAGSSENIKVTLPEDLAVVEALLKARVASPPLHVGERETYPGYSQSPGADALAPAESALHSVERGGAERRGEVRVGTGYDIHRLVPGRRLVLGGVAVPSELGLAGHSDGDALAHAVTDALFGACGLPDIGQHFPPDDARYRDANSIALLEEARRLAGEAGWRPRNLDATVVCERPRLAPFLLSIRANLARALRLSETNVSVKAKTNEGLDAVGRGEAIAAHAIIMIVAESA